MIIVARPRVPMTLRTLPSTRLRTHTGCRPSHCDVKPSADRLRVHTRVPNAITFVRLRWTSSVAIFVKRLCTFAVAGCDALGTYSSCIARFCFKVSHVFLRLSLHHDGSIPVNDGADQTVRRPKAGH